MSERGSDEPEKKPAGNEDEWPAPDPPDARDADEWDDTPRRRRWSLPVWVVALGVVLALLGTYALIRIAGEQHYQSCVAAVNGRYGTASDPLTRIARSRTIDACSRSPF